ncbi:10707_t:CDS:1, partial [Dentiscutata erythropus]
FQQHRTIPNNKPSSLTTLLSSELNQYLALPENKKETNSLLWWQLQVNKYPVLSKIALDYLSIQAISVVSEWVFSIASNTITKTRNWLSPETAKVTLCMKS